MAKRNLCLPQYDRFEKKMQILKYLKNYSNSQYLLLAVQYSFLLDVLSRTPFGFGAIIT